MTKKNTAQQNILILVMSIISVTFLMSVISYLIFPQKVEEVIITPKAQEIINSAKKITTFQNPDIISKEDEYIQAAAFDSDCNINLITNHNEILVQTSLGQEGTIECSAGQVFGEISDSGKYYAFDDISGGVDSMLRLYILDYNKTVTLAVWGTNSIQDYIFLPGDDLLSLSGYPESYNEQILSLFNIPKIIEEFYKNFDENNNLSVSNLSYHSLVDLPNVGQSYSFLAYDTDTDHVQVFNDDVELLIQYTKEDLQMKNSILNIDPETAKVIAYYKYTSSNNNEGTELRLNWVRTTLRAWAIDVVNLENNNVLKTYYVDAMTGVVN